MLAVLRRDRQRLAEVEEQQRPAFALVLARQQMIEAVPVEADQRLLGERLVGPLAALVPPGDDRRDVQVLGPHQQLDVLHRPMHVQLAGPPALRRQVHDAPQHDLDRAGSPVLDGKVPGRTGVLGAALDLERVRPRRQRERQLARKHELIAKERQPGGLHRLARRILQMHPASDRLPRIGIGHGEIE